MSRNEAILVVAALIDTFAMGFGIGISSHVDVYPKTKAQPVVVDSVTKTDSPAVQCLSGDTVSTVIIPRPGFKGLASSGDWLDVANCPSLSLDFPSKTVICK